MTLLTGFFMLELHAFIADTAGYTHHHKVDMLFLDKQKLMITCMKMIKSMHDVMRLDDEVVTLNNKKVIIDNKEVTGVMVTSTALPYSFFALGVEVDTDDTIMFDPSLPNHLRVSKVPEC